MVVADRSGEKFLLFSRENIEKSNKEKRKRISKRRSELKSEQMLDNSEFEKPIATLRMHHR